MDRLPFQATAAGAHYERIARLPVAILLDNVRSLYNVGAFFRTADAAGWRSCTSAASPAARPRAGSPRPRWAPRRRVPWEHAWEPRPAGAISAKRGYEIAAIETSVHAVDLFDWTPRFPVCVVFGHEVDGIQPETVSALCDTHVRIPMLGTKHSLNVATAGGVVVYELLRKYRALSAGYPETWQRRSPDFASTSTSCPRPRRSIRACSFATRTGIPTRCW